MFSGLKYPISLSASAGRIAVEKDYERYVAALIYQVLMTRPGERINRPDFGSGIRSMVFAPLSDASANLAQTSVYTALQDQLDAFIVVEDVRVEVREPAALLVTVVFIIRATNERRFLNVEVTE